MAIIKYKVTYLGMTNIVYEEITHPNKRGRKLTKGEAMERISKKKLVKALENEHGVIWDTPDRQFYETYKGEEIKDI